MTSEECKAPDMIKRYENAFKIVEAGGVTLLEQPFTAKVISQGKKEVETYEVMYALDYFYCKCPDFDYNLQRLKPCKHILAARIKSGLICGCPARLTN